MMTHTYHKLFTVGEFEKEEQWLNEMSEKGLQLIHVGFCKYIFKEGIPGEYVYRLELLKNLPSDAESIDYVRFMNELGVEKVGSIFRWVYFRRKAMDRPFDLFSDIHSKIKHYNRINVLCNWVSGVNLVTGFFNLIIYVDSIPSLKMNVFDTIRYSNLWVSVINILLATIVFFIAHPLRKRLNELRKEKGIRE